MKRLTALLCSLILTLLCSCGSQTVQPFSPALERTLLESNIFSEPLEPLDMEIACLLYQLDPEQAGLTGLQAHRSAGATCEEVAVFTFETDEDAADAQFVLAGYLAAQLESCRSYMPDQAPKLQHAILTRRANSVLLVVAEDWAAAAEQIR